MNKIEITVLSARVLDALSVRGLKAKTVREFERYGTRRIVQHCLDNGQTIYFKETVQDFVWQERARMESGALPHYQWVLTRRAAVYLDHIFNEAEIKAFFHGADSFRPHEKAPARHLVIPVFYRLLYCCGLRPAEARLLKKENVDLVRGAVYVVESKGHKDRVVAVADDLLQIMRSYSTLISEIYPDSDYFFPRYDGEGPYTKRWTEEMFWRCFSMAGITAFEGPKPRVYDFRHTFATECICRWMREGRDIDAMLPFLSAYMGHARYEDTLYYVHMVPDFYERVGTVDRTAWEKLLPEVHDEG